MHLIAQVRAIKCMAGFVLQPSLYDKAIRKDVTNLWEKEFLERFRKERSAQHPLRRAPNSCVTHRAETVSTAFLLCRVKTPVTVP